MLLFANFCLGKQSTYLFHGVAVGHAWRPARLVLVLDKLGEGVGSSGGRRCGGRLPSSSGRIVECEAPAALSAALFVHVDGLGVTAVGGATPGATVSVLCPDLISVTSADDGELW